jgi:hypothetical protein
MPRFNLLNQVLEKSSKEKIKKDLGLNNIYMYNKLVKNSGSDNILDYINKYTV